MKAFNTIEEVYQLTRHMHMHKYGTGHTRTLKPTHIIQDLDTMLSGKISAFCGANIPHHNYLTLNEILGRPVEHQQEVFMEEEELEKYRSTLCPKCLEHPDYALGLLAGC